MSLVNNENFSDWCANNGMEFKILTEDHLGISYK